MAKVYRRGVAYDPDRYGEKFKRHMNSPKVVKEHKRIIKDVKKYQRGKYERMQEQRGY